MMRGGAAACPGALSGSGATVVRGSGQKQKNVFNNTANFTLVCAFQIGAFGCSMQWFLSHLMFLLSLLADSYMGVSVNGYSG